MSVQGERVVQLKAMHRTNTTRVNPATRQKGLLISILLPEMVKFDRPYRDPLAAQEPAFGGKDQASSEPRGLPHPRPSFVQPFCAEVDRFVRAFDKYLVVMHAKMVI